MHVPRLGRLLVFDQQFNLVLNFLDFFIVMLKLNNTPPRLKGTVMFDHMKKGNVVMGDHSNMVPT